MEEFFTTIFSTLSKADGPKDVIIFILSAIVWFQYEEGKKKDKALEKKDEKIDKIVEDYYKGNLTLADALNSLKIVLYEIKAKL